MSSKVVNMNANKVIGFATKIRTFEHNSQLYLWGCDSSWRCLSDLENIVYLCCVLPTYVEFKVLTSFVLGWHRVIVVSDCPRFLALLFIHILMAEIMMVMIIITKWRFKVTVKWSVVATMTPNNVQTYFSLLCWYDICNHNWIGWIIGTGISRGCLFKFESWVYWTFCKLVVTLTAIFRLTVFTCNV